MPYLIADTGPVFWSVGNPPVASGLTEVGGATLTGLTLYSDANPNTYLGQLPTASFPPLPDSGWLEQHAIYAWSGVLIMVRQSHNRTIYPPDATPALFLVYRPGGGGVLEWVAGEQVYVGTHRMYGGIEYECIQAHVTQADWTPPATPALWRVVAPPSTEWQPYVAYAVGAIVTYLGITYSCRQAHTSLPGWEPPATPALWLAV